MALHGRQLLGAERSSEGAKVFRGVDPATGAELAPDFHEATAAEVDRALALAAEAQALLKHVDRAARAAFLERVAAEIEGLGSELLVRAASETGLPNGRLTMERGRTANQLRTFAAVVRDGAHLDPRIDRAEPDRQPLPRPDIRRLLRPIGPVVVFGASNFPLAFSVAGGDTASALAAGCPVVVKAHPHHPGTSELVGEAIHRAVVASDLPPGTFSLLHGQGVAVGQWLVEHPETRAVGFTGSLRGGRALFDLASSRPGPIPVYAEMGSTNPLFLLPGALARRGGAIATGLQQSVCLGAGQFCTNPGLVFLADGPGADDFVDALRAQLTAAPPALMLHSGILTGFEAGVARLAAVPGVRSFRGQGASPTGCARPTACVTDAATFLAHPVLAEEVFGPATLVVRSPDRASTLACARALEGQLTATLQAEPEELGGWRDLIDVLEEKAGRLVLNAFPTGVEVCAAMQHGGPYPASTDVRTTSVGTAAVARFLRPVAYQGFPSALLPPELRDEV